MINRIETIIRENWESGCEDEEPTRFRRAICGGGSFSIRFPLSDAWKNKK